MYSMSDDIRTLGDNEESFVKTSVARVKAHRKAEGTVEGYNVTVGVVPSIDGGVLNWKLYSRATSDVGTETVGREYQSRGDAYRGLDYLINEHNLSEVVDTHDSKQFQQSPSEFDSVDSVLEKLKKHHQSDHDPVYKRE